MNNSKLIFDIRTSKAALETLINLTGVPKHIWEAYVGTENNYRYTEDLIEYVTDSYGYLPKSYKEFIFIYFHITTSSNNCASIEKYGILDLVNSYLCPDSELRTFLDKHNVYIDLDSCLLNYHEFVYDITYGACPRRNTPEHNGWAIGRKFYYDYTTCGFLSIWEEIPYGGQVHRRPEILMDIDNLLGTNLSKEWENTHYPYEVVAQVSGNNIVYDSYDKVSEKEKVLSFLAMAYNTAFGSPDEKILLLQNNTQIPPEDILEIKPLQCWITPY